MCLSVADDFEKAVGQMYLAANDIKDEHGGKCKLEISEMYQLECETGIGINAKITNEKNDVFEHSLYLLYNHDQEEKEDGEK